MTTFSERLQGLLTLSDVDYIQSYSDIVTDEDKQKVYNVIEELRLLIDNLSKATPELLMLENKDFYAIYTELISVARNKFPEWTDFNDSNIGTMLLQLVAMMFDKFFFMQDEVFRQFLFSTMTREFALVDKSKELGYSLSTREAASVSIEFIIINSREYDIEIPSATKLSTDDSSFDFETEEIAIIPAGFFNVITTARHWGSDNQQIVMDGTKADQIVVIENTPVIVEEIAIIIDGDTWIPVDNFLNSNDISQHYTIRAIENEQIEIKFGDGVNGMQPDGAGTVYYKVGGGADVNNVLVNAINQLHGVFNDVNGSLVSDIAVTNLNKPSGGVDKLDFNKEKMRVVSQLKQLERTVTNTDYEDNAMLVTGVSRALSLDVVYDSTIEAGKVVVYIVPTGGGELTESLKAMVEEKLLILNPNPHDKILEVVSTNYFDFDISGTIYVKSGFEIVDIEGLSIEDYIKEELIKYFDFDNMDKVNEFTNDWGFKKPKIYDSVISELIQKFYPYGVRNVILDYPTSPIDIPSKEIPLLGNMDNLVVEVIT